MHCVPLQEKAGGQQLRGRKEEKETQKCRRLEQRNKERGEREDADAGGCNHRGGMKIKLQAHGEKFFLSLGC